MENGPPPSNLEESTTEPAATPSLTAAIDGVSVTAQVDEIDALSADEVVKELRKMLRRASFNAKKAESHALQAEQTEAESKALFQTASQKVLEAQKLLDDAVASAEAILGAAFETLDSKVEGFVSAAESKLNSTVSNVESKTETAASEAQTKLDGAVAETHTKANNAITDAETKLSAAVGRSQEALQKADDSANSAIASAEIAGAASNASQTHVASMASEVRKYFHDELSENHLPSLQAHAAAALDRFKKECWGDDGKSGSSKTVADSISQLEQASGRASELIETLTDVSIHGAFNKRERTIDRRHTAYQILLIGCVVSLVAVGYSLVTTKPTLPDILLHSSLLLPLSYLLWVVNRTIKVEKRLAESYRHKASVMDALIGYRNLFKLKHDEEEYLKIFDRLHAEIVDDPGKHIDKLLTSRLEDGSSPGLFTGLFGTKKPVFTPHDKEPTAG